MTDAHAELLDARLAFESACERAWAALEEAAGHVARGRSRANQIRAHGDSWAMAEIADEFTDDEREAMRLARLVLKMIDRRRGRAAEARAALEAST